VKKVTLPATALEVLPAIVRNKVESLAPWPLSEVMWGYRVSDTAQSGQVGVDVAIVSRKSADVLLSAVHNAGVKVIQLDVGDRSDDPHGIQIDFLGPARAKRARRLVTSVMSAAAIAALMAGTYGLYLALSLQSELASVDRRARLLEEKLLGGGTAKVSAKLSEANKLYQRRKESLPVVAMLNSLTKAVPNGTWLNGIDYGGGQLTITGRGNGIAGVIESLEKSDTFANVNFASATQRDASLQADIFSISADIQANGGPQ
jgi:general secretion pathway protein L